MAHNFKRIGRYRWCSACNKVQVQINWVDPLGTGWWKWQPRIGRCTTNANPGRKPKTRDAILAVMDGPTHVLEIVERTGLTRRVVQSALTRVKNAGKVQGVEGERGVWEKVERCSGDLVAGVRGR